MPYPSTVTSFTNPLPGDKLNAPSHSSIETAQNTGLTELQTFVGTLSSAVGTLVYDIRSANSNGGGHVQTVNKGGTGQTTYTKGDLLVATSASVLSKFAVGLDGQTLVSDSSVAAGIKWSSQNTFSNKIATSTSIQTFGSSTVGEVSIFSVTVPGSTLGLSNAVRANVFLSDFWIGTNGASVLAKLQFGNNQIGSVLITGPRNQSVVGKVEMNVVGTGSSVFQRNTTYFNVDKYNTGTSTPNSVMTYLVRGTSSVDSSAPQTLGMTMQWPDNSLSNYATIDGYIVEKIA